MLDVWGLILGLCGAAPLTLAAHELSHLGAAKLVHGSELDSVQFVWYPHHHHGTFYLARVHYAPPIEGKARGLVSLAPRLTNLIQIVGSLWLATELERGWRAGALAMALAAICDLVIGSLGVQPMSDLRRAARALRWDPNVLRMAGFGLAIAGVVGAWWVWDSW